MAANNVTIYNFLAWIREQIEPDKLSALITEYNYTDDSDETIMDALQTYAEFKNDLGRLLGQSIIENKAEINRSVGGISYESTSLSLSDWQKIVNSGLDRAVGGATTEPKKGLDWNGLLNTILVTAGGVVGSIFGAKNPQQEAPQPQPQQNSGSSIAIWIVVGVVVIAVIAILWMSLSRK